MKCLDETAHDIARRMRSLADGVSNPADAEAIRRYADWLERSDNTEEAAAVEPKNDEDESATGGHVRSRCGARGTTFDGPS